MTDAHRASAEATAYFAGLNRDHSEIRERGVIEMTIQRQQAI